MARVTVPYTLDLDLQAVGAEVVWEISYVMQEGDSRRVFFGGRKAGQRMGQVSQFFEHESGIVSVDCCFVGSAVCRKNPQHDNGH